MTPLIAQLLKIYRSLGGSGQLDTTELDSIYCAREGLSTKNCSFAIEDVTIVVLPREQEGERFYERLLEEVN